MVLPIVLLTALAVASGCGGKSAPSTGTGVPPGPAAKVSTAKAPVEGSHEDRTYIDTGARLSQYKAVYVAPPAMDTTAGRTEKVDDFLKSLETTIRSSSESSLRNTKKFALVTTNESEAKARGKYLVYRNDVLVHFGSTAARWIVGYGAGRSKLIVVPSLEDPATKNVFVKYTGWGGLALGGSGSEVLSKMQGDAVTIESYFSGLVQRVPK
jgi:hypothetical protein